MGGSTKVVNTTPKDTQQIRQGITGFLNSGANGQGSYFGPGSNFTPQTFQPGAQTISQIGNQGNQGQMGGVTNKPNFMPQATDTGGMVPSGPGYMPMGSGRNGQNPSNFNLGGGSLNNPANLFNGPMPATRGFMPEMPNGLTTRNDGMPSWMSGPMTQAMGAAQQQNQQNQQMGAQNYGQIFAQLPGAPPMVQGQYAGNVTASQVPTNFNIPMVNPGDVPAVTTQFNNQGIGQQDYGALLKQLGSFVGMDPNGGFPGTGGSGMAAFDPAAMSAYKNELKPFFDQSRAEALAAAREASGNLTGSGFANRLGVATNRSLGDEQKTLADYANQRAAQAAQLNAAAAGSAGSAAASRMNLLNNLFGTIVGDTTQRETGGANLGLDYAKLGQGGEQFNSQLLANLLQGNQQAGITGSQLFNNANQFNAGQQNQIGLANQNALQGVLSGNAGLAQQYFQNLFNTNAGINQGNANNFLQLLSMMGSTGVGPNTVQQSGGFGSMLGGLLGTGVGALAGGAGAGLGGKLGSWLGGKMGG